MQKEIKRSRFFLPSIHASESHCVQPCNKEPCGILKTNTFLGAEVCQLQDVLAMFVFLLVLVIDRGMHSGHGQRHQSTKASHVKQDHPGCMCLNLSLII